MTFRHFRIINSTDIIIYLIDTFYLSYQSKKVKVFQFDNILYEKNYGEIEGVEKIKKLVKA